VFADEDGESHFEEGAMAMEPVDYAPPAASLDLAPLGTASTLSVVGSDADWEGEAFHPAPARQCMTMLRGRVMITVSDGSSREFGLGELFLLEDTRGKGHASRFFEECLIAAVRLAG
jgi:hypothetical protein